MNNSLKSHYQEVTPTPELAGRLCCLWHNTIRPGDEGFRKSVLPDGCVDIIWIGDREPIVAGPATKSVQVLLPAGATLIGSALAHNARSIEEVDQIFADLKAKGADIVKEPQKPFWGGYSGYFADPDGNRWEIAYNPYWTVSKDGRIKMQPPDA